MKRLRSGNTPDDSWPRTRSAPGSGGVHSASSDAVAPAARIARLAAAAITPLLTSCSYLDNRLTDLHDCFLYRWHESALGVAATAKLGPLEATVGGWYADWGWGKDTWWQRPGYVLTCHGTGVPLTTIGPLAYQQSWSRLLATSSSGNHPAAPGSFDDARSWLFVSDVFDFDDERPFQLTSRQRIADLFGIEVGVVPLIAGLHVGFNVAEFADFLLGWVGIDVLADDGVERPPTVPFVPAPERPVPRHGTGNVPR